MHPAASQQHGQRAPLLLPMCHIHPVAREEHKQESKLPGPPALLGPSAPGSSFTTETQAWKARERGYHREKSYRALNCQPPVTDTLRA